MSKKLFSALGAACMSVALLCTAFPAAAQFAGQPSNLIDPATGCSQGALSGCAFRTANDPFPLGATPITATSGVVGAATATATLPGVAAKTTYLQGLRITSSGATAATVVTCTVTGTISGSLNYVQTVVAGVTLANPGVSESFGGGLIASAPNTAIVVSCPSLGSGNTAIAINAYGYQK